MGSGNEIVSAACTFSSPEVALGRAPFGPRNHGADQKERGLWGRRLDFQPLWESGYPPPNYGVVWGKERGLTKRLEFEPTGDENAACIAGFHTVRAWVQVRVL